MCTYVGDAPHRFLVENLMHMASSVLLAGSETPMRMASEGRPSELRHRARKGLAS